MAAELKQRDISWNNKPRENMSPAKEVMMLLVQSMKTGVVLEKCWEPPRSARPRGTGQWISIPAIMKTSRLHSVAQEQVQRNGSALVCHQGIKAQATVKHVPSAN